MRIKKTVFFQALKVVDKTLTILPNYSAIANLAQQWNIENKNSSRDSLMRIRPMTPRQNLPAEDSKIS